MMVIGVTGGVGSGKSLLLQYMKEHYPCRVFMADEAGHEVSRRDGRAYPALVKLLGQYAPEESFLSDNGEIERAKMASVIFLNPELRDQVNAIVHPAVQELIISEIEKTESAGEAGEAGAVRYFILEAALLIECGYAAVVDEMWYIYCDPAVRIRRLREGRGYSEEKTRSIMYAQLTDAGFRAGADVVIDNSGKIEDTYRRIDMEFARLSSAQPSR